MLALAAGVAIHLYFVVQPNENFGARRNFFEAKQDSYDVFLMGSSHAAALSPNVLYEQYGITSYNLSCLGNSLSRTLATLKMAVQYHTPKLVVLDVDHYWTEDNFEDHPGDWHATFDYFPFSLEKCRQVIKLAPDLETKKELLFDAIRYHGRVAELTREDFTTPVDASLGAHIRVGSVSQRYFEPYQSCDLLDTEAFSQEAATLCAFLDYCKDNQINVLLTCLPHSAKDKAQSRFYAIHAIADSYGVPFYNFLEYEPVIDYACDLRDEGHLNLLGAKKTTTVLGAEILKHFDLEDHRQDADDSARWDNIQMQYRQALLDAAFNPELIVGYKEALVLFGTDVYCGEIYFKNSESFALQKPGMKELITEAVGGQDLPKLADAIDTQSDYLLVYNRNADTIQEFCGEEVGDLLGDADDLPLVSITLRDAETLDVITEYEEE